MVRMGWMVAGALRASFRVAYLEASRPRDSTDAFTVRPTAHPIKRIASALPPWYYSVSWVE